MDEESPFELVEMLVYEDEVGDEDLDVDILKTE